MALYFFTRSTGRDYDFLGTPTKRWWSDDYGAFTILELFNFIGETNGPQWHIYVSGIPSARRDRVSRQIRYVLAFDHTGADAGADAGEDAKLVKNLAAFLLGSYTGKASVQSQLAELGKRLDEQFPAQYVDSLDSNRRGVDVTADVTGRARTALAFLPAAPPAPAGDHKSAVYKLNGTTVKYFLSRVATIGNAAASEQAFAILNLPPDKQSIERWWEARGATETALFISDTVAPIIGSNSVIFPLEPKKKASQTRAYPTPTARGTGIGIKPIHVAVAVAVVILVAMIAKCAGG